MTPSPEQQEHMKFAQQAALRNAQTFQAFLMLVSSGKRPDEALREAEEAIDVWKVYEEAHAIEPPPMPDLTAMLGKFSDMADRIGTTQRDPIDAEFASPDELCRMEQDAWDSYQDLKSHLESLHEVVSPEATAALEREVLELENQWRSYGTAHLRLQLAQLTGGGRRTAPSNPSTSQIQDGAKA